MDDFRIYHLQRMQRKVGTERSAFGMVGTSFLSLQLVAYILTLMRPCRGKNRGRRREQSAMDG